MERVKNYIIGAMALMLFIGYLSYSDIKQGNVSLGNVIEQQRDSVKLWRDKYGLAQAERQILEVDRETFKELYEEELAKSFEKIKPKNVASTTSISTSTKDSIKIKVLPDGTFRHRASWADFSGSLSDGLIKFSFDKRDSIKLVSHYQRRWFKPDLYKVQAMSHNPSTTFTSLQTIEIKERVKRFSVGPALIYDPFSNRLRVGVGLTYGLFRF